MNTVGVDFAVRVHNSSSCCKWRNKDAEEARWGRIIWVAFVVRHKAMT